MEHWQDLEGMMSPCAMYFDDMGMNNKHIRTKIMMEQLLAQISQNQIYYN